MIHSCCVLKEDFLLSWFPGAIGDHHHNATDSSLEGHRVMLPALEKEQSFNLDQM